MMDEPHAGEMPMWMRDLRRQQVPQQTQLKLHERHTASWCGSPVPSSIAAASSAPTELPSVVTTAKMPPAASASTLLSLLLANAPAPRPASALCAPASHSNAALALGHPSGEEEAAGKIHVLASLVPHELNAHHVVEKTTVSSLEMPKRVNHSVEEEEGGEEDFASETLAWLKCAKRRTREERNRDIVDALNQAEAAEAHVAKEKLAVLAEKNPVALVVSEATRITPQAALCGDCRDHSWWVMEMRRLGLRKCTDKGCPGTQEGEGIFGERAMSERRHSTRAGQAGSGVKRKRRRRRRITAAAAAASKSKGHLKVCIEIVRADPPNAACAVDVVLLRPHSETTKKNRRVEHAQRLATHRDPSSSSAAADILPSDVFPLPIKTGKHVDSMFFQEEEEEDEEFCSIAERDPGVQHLCAAIPELARGLASFDEALHMWCLPLTEHDSFVQRLTELSSRRPWVHRYTIDICAASPRVHDLLRSSYPASRLAWRPPASQPRVAQKRQPLVLAEENQLSSSYECSRHDGALTWDRIAMRLPNALASTLHAWQRESILWAVRERHGRCLFGDEMGCGKTLQAIAAAAVFVEDWPLLIVCPASLRLSWRAALLRWLPSLRLRGRPASSGAPVDTAGPISGVSVPDSSNMRLFQRYVSLSDVVILSYEIASTLSQRDVLGVVDRATGMLHPFAAVIVDESHYLKNPWAYRTQHLFPVILRARRAFLLSGTPALSRPAELFTQAAALQPHLFESLSLFGYRYCNAVRGRWGMEYKGAHKCVQLHALLTKFIMTRHLKRDVLTELSPKVRVAVVENVLPANFEAVPAQFRIEPGVANALASRVKSLRSVLSKVLRCLGKRDVKRNSEDRDHGNLSDTDTGSSGMAGPILSLPTSNCQKPGATSSNAQARHTLFTLYSDTCRVKVAQASRYLLDMLFGSDNSGRSCAKSSMKPQRRRKILVFAHHLSMLDALEAVLGDEAGVFRRGRMSYMRIDGATSFEERQSSVNEFQTVDSCRVALLSLHAAGTGLTLTAATDVLFTELVWTPSLLMQAEDRAHRIGQAGQVLCTYLVLNQTLDDVIWPLLVEKLKVVGRAIDGTNDGDRENLPFHAVYKPA